VIQTLLRATPEDLPNLLAALGLTERPKIYDDPDPDVGMSWDLPQTGIEISFDDGRVSTVFLYGPAKFELRHYRGPLPRQLAWNTSFDTVIATHGMPTRYSHGGGDADGPLGPVPPWIRYDGNDHCVHIQFMPDKTQTAMVSVTTAERSP
jgi:hypothetical protein